MSNTKVRQFNRLTSSAEGQNPYIGTFQDYLDGIIPSVFEHFDFGIRESFLPRVLIPYLSSERAHWGCPSTCPLQSSSTTWEAQGCIFGRTATVPTSDPHTHASSQFLAFWRMSNIDLPPKLGQYKLKQKLFSRNEKLIGFKVGFENRFWESGTRSWPKRRLVGEV